VRTLNFTAEQEAAAVARGAVVYFIEAPEVGAIKIGTTGRADKDLHARVLAVRTHSPVPVALLGTMRGSLLLERRLHLMFEHLRRHGEWFDAGLDLVEFIRENVTPPTPRVDQRRFVLGPRSWAGHSGHKPAPTNNLTPEDLEWRRLSAEMGVAP
jgi:hypothetical protein